MKIDLLQKAKPDGQVDTIFFEKLISIDLEPIMFRMIKGKRYLWSVKKAVQTAELFKCFLYLVHKYPTAIVVPTHDIDDFWHEYLGDNAKYNVETSDLFGGILTHFGYYGMRDDADAKHRDASFAKTLSLFEEQFGNADLYLGETSNCGADCLFEISANCGADCLFESGIPTQSRMAQNGVSKVRPTLASL
jgi:hypothetical protein